MNSAQRQVELAASAEALLLSSAPTGIDLNAAAEDNQAEKKGTSALRIAEELERRLALAAQPVVDTAETIIPASADESASFVQQETDAELEITPDAEAIKASEGSSKDEAAPPEDASQQEGQGAEPDEDSYEEGSAPSLANESLSETATESPSEEEVQAEAAEPAEQSPLPEMAQEDASTEIDPQSEPESAALTTIEHEKEEEEDEALAQESAWNVARLQELAYMLSQMAGEATLQERNARTMDYKLLALLQGLPDTRGVDMMAAWLRAFLEAVTQSANQVRQASKALPASAFSSSGADSAGSQDHV
jgi:hypothetical protein